MSLVNSRAEVSHKMKTLLVLALTFIKRVGDLYAFSVERFVPKVWTGGFPDNPEAPARLCAQGSHFSLRGPSGEPASAAPEEADPALALLVPSER